MHRPPDTSPDTPIDPTRCPLCGADNRCAREIELSTGQAQPPCWCVGETFTPELLARLPAAAAGVACLCQGCVRASLSDPQG